jgi:hypothetical protein
MNVIIDLGTSRTAIAIADDRYIPQPLSNPIWQRNNPGSGWAALDSLMAGIGNENNLSLKYESIHHVVTHSRYWQIGNLIIPISQGGSDVQLPAGSSVVPDLQDQRFRSIKEDTAWATSFLSALTTIVRAWSPQGARWVIGQSCGGIDPRGALPAGSLTFNEAIAVIFALVSLDNGNLLGNSEDKFVVLADLGGGFLDVSVAHKVVLGENDGMAEIVNYGGYPLGVDRIGGRFSRQPIDNAGGLTTPILAAIAYHIQEYSQKSDHKTSGVVFLTGGGFRRLGNVPAEIRRRLPSLTQKLGLGNVEVSFVDKDTKYLTIAGLLRLARLEGQKKMANFGDDLSGQHHLTHGKEILKELDIPSLPDAPTWYSLADRLRHETYRPPQR